MPAARTVSKATSFTGKMADSIPQGLHCQWTCSGALFLLFLVSQPQVKAYLNHTNSRNPSGRLRLGPRLAQSLGYLAPGHLPAGLRRRLHPHHLYPLPPWLSLPRRAGPRPAMPPRLLLPPRHLRPSSLPVRPIHVWAWLGGHWRLQRVLSRPASFCGAGLCGNSCAGANCAGGGGGTGTRCCDFGCRAAAAAGSWDRGTEDRSGEGAGNGDAVAAGETEDYYQ
jgi:hypothetical protein